ncbi:hypothetical protein CK203_098111 [Vitis vinifera]|uniref:Uncharacterized protein n=1 Tax=Vitis vinifera TaxID=29760 RepID=A0A438C637_VITVI|nr:hypothetical protein CK203_098111 [Vitis vinifera]
MYVLNEDIDMKAKVAAMPRRLEELEMKKIQEVPAISETSVQAMPCSICQSSEHLVEECPTIPAVREMFGDQANVIVAAQEGESSKVREVKAVVTLRSGKEVDQPTSKPKHDEDSVAEKEKSEEIKGKRKGKNTKKYDHDSSVDEEPERIVIKEDMMKKHMPPPFPQALHGKKGTYIASEIFEVLRQVKANIPLLDMIKQVPTYAKFLKDLCTVKRGLNVNKKAFLTEQVSAIIQCKSPVNVNLLPYSVYKQLELGELKPTSITLSLADRSVKIPRWMIEDVLVQVNKFYYPVDFVVIDTDLVIKGTNYVPIILGRPFLATSSSIINCRNGVMQLTFGNMTLELNISICAISIFIRKRRRFRGSVHD